MATVADRQAKALALYRERMARLEQSGGLRVTTLPDQTSEEGRASLAHRPEPKPKKRASNPRYERAVKLLAQRVPISEIAATVGRSEAWVRKVQRAVKTQ